MTCFKTQAALFIDFQTRNWRFSKSFSHLFTKQNLLMHLQRQTWGQKLKHACCANVSTKVTTIVGLQPERSCCVVFFILTFCT